ncbi:MAG: hypothetical protein OEN20_00795 [Gammaproteobacteria bacterium]|nr:hypothetical protein [Gammaproteobacteria bacterium]
MASGDPLIPLDAWSGVPASIAGATFGTITGATEVYQCANFDDTTIQYLDFMCEMPSAYGGGGITVKIRWAAASATNAVVWQAALRRIEDDVDDIETSHTYDYNAAAAATAPTVIGELSFDTITFTNGADMDSVAAGDLFVLRIRRKADDAGDTMSGDARLISVNVTET